MSYDSEDGKDAWKRYRRIVEATDPAMQEMLHEFGADQFGYGYAAGLDAAREAVLNAGLCAPHRCQSDALAAIDALREEEPCAAAE